MQKVGLKVTLDTTKLKEELNQLISLLEEADKLIDSISSTDVKNLISFSHINQ